MKPLELIRTDKDVDFTGGLIQNAGANANVTGMVNNNAMIHTLIVMSVENLAWEIQFYSADTFDNADPDLDTYLGSVRFAEGDGLQVAGAGTFKYDVHGLELPYADADRSNELHIKLVNRSAAAKTAGAPGNIVVVVGYEAGMWV